MPEDKNIYIEELKKCIGKKVKVKTMDGEEIEGSCRAINFMHLSIILMTDKEKIIIKNIQKITRERKK